MDPTDSDSSTTALAEVPRGLREMQDFEDAADARLENQELLAPQRDNFKFAYFRKPGHAKPTRYAIKRLSFNRTQEIQTECVKYISKKGENGADESHFTLKAERRRALCLIETLYTVKDGAPFEPVFKPLDLRTVLARSNDPNDMVVVLGDAAIHYAMPNKVDEKLEAEKKD